MNKNDIMKNLIITADIKEYLPQLDREEITISRLAEILNELANERARNYIISNFDASETLINQLENKKTMKTRFNAAFCFFTNYYDDYEDFVTDFKRAGFVEDGKEELMTFTIEGDCNLKKKDFVVFEKLEKIDTQFTIGTLDFFPQENTKQYFILH